jgi:hypothetical protein
MANERVRDAAGAVVEAYGAFTAPTEEARQQLARIREHVQSWFDSPARRVTDAAVFSIDKFADAEIDYVTPGNRGFGRIGDNLPRLAARHRSVISRMSGETRQHLGRLIRRHIVCGYLFAESGYELSRENEPQVSPQKLFEMWVPSIYSSFFNLDPRSKDEEDIKTIWFGATGRSIRDHLQSHGASWEELDMQIVTHYFNGGMLLRMLEARPLTDEQVSNIATGGAYGVEKALSAATGGKYTIEQLEQAVNVSTGGAYAASKAGPAKSSGCLVLVAALSMLLGLAAVAIIILP